ncbi:tape measure protein [Arthrobacter sp. GMC3]|uniref:tape measure protein n=1 Tax=Arthrobacter sp. GMC3 TaxID=2058894 RepID=UPI000CE3B6A4|nr:tape measure protein [Arthrobacter sp. GMC3]
MALTIGELVGYLRLNSTDFDRNLAGATGAMGDFAVTGQRTGDKAGNSLLSAVGSAALKVGKIVTGAVAAVGGIVTGLAIKGGIARQLQIEDAEASLLGLGNSTESVAAIMANAMASVKGTAFGMGEAASTAAGAVAAGIQPGRDLERVLKLVGDSATIAKTDMASMGSIFNKVAASGKLQGDVIAQLQDSGVPVLQMVAKQMGVTAAEASKMASDGKVSFEIFADAMEAGLGGAALKSGDTTRGAFANMKAAFSRFGVVLTSWFMPLMKMVFNAIGKAVDGLTAVLKPFSTQFGEWFQGKMGPAIDSFGNAAVTWFGKLGVAAGTLQSLFSSFVTGFTMPRLDGGALESGLSTIATVGYKARDMFNEVVGGVVAFVSGLREGGNDVTSGGFAGILESIGLAIRNLWDAFGPMAEQAGGIGDLVDAFSPMGILMAALAPVLPQLAESAGTLAGTLSGALLVAVQALLPVVNGIVLGIADVVNGFMSTEAGANTLVGVIVALGAGFLAFKATMLAISIATKAYAAYTAVVRGATAAWAVVQAVLNGVLFVSPLSWIILGIVALIAVIILLVKNWDSVVGFLQGAWQGFIDWFTGIMSSVVSWIGQNWGLLLSLLIGPLGFAIQWIVEHWSEISAFFAAFFSDTLGMFSDFGTNTVGMFVDFFSNTIGMVKDFAGNLAAPFAAGMAIVKVIFTQGWEILQTAVATVLAVIIAIVTGQFDKIPGYFVSAFQKIAGFFTAGLAQIDTILGGAITNMVNMAISIWTGLVAWVQSIPQQIVNALIGLAMLGLQVGAWILSVKDAAISKFMELVAWVQGIPGMIVNALIALALLGIQVGAWILSVKDAAVGKFLELVNWVKGVPGMVLNGIASIGGLAGNMAGWIGAVKDAAVNKFFDLVNWVRGVPGLILGALGNMGRLLADAGQQIMDGFLSGLQGAFKGVQDFVGGIGDWIKDHKGPKAYDLALLVPAGGWIMDGLQGGIKKSMPSLKNTLGDVSWMIANGIDPELGIGGNYAFSGLGNGLPEPQMPAASTVYNQTFNVEKADGVDSETQARGMAEQIMWKAGV